VTDEARMVDRGHGLVPSGEGWFVVNLADAEWRRSESFGSWCRFEGDARFPQVGINVSIIEPGKPSCMYHGEDTQEGFLVLQGSCLLLVEGEERTLRQWDFFHSPAWTEHVLVGTDEPCLVLAVGARPDLEVVYPAAEVALRHGAGVPVETRDADEAYAPYAPTEPVSSPIQSP
jgi:uncharacterized cupin superfamily protein